MYCVIAEGFFEPVNMADEHLHFYETAELAADDQSQGELVIECTFKPIGRIGILPLDSEAKDCGATSEPVHLDVNELKIGEEYFRSDGKTTNFQESTANGYGFIAEDSSDGLNGLWWYDEQGKLLGYESRTDPRHIIRKA